MAGQRNWSDLPVELLDMIFASKLFSFVDVLNVKLVCSSWRRVIARIKNPKNLHLLVFFQAVSSIERSVCFLGSDDQEAYSFVKKPFPSLWSFPGLERYNNGHSRETVSIIGSHPSGWVILMEQGEDFRICNLVTEVSIPVPRNMQNGPQAYLELATRCRNVRAILSHNPCCCNDFVVVMIMILRGPRYLELQDGEIGFWRYGDEVWSPLGRGELSYIDIAFCDYTLYTLKAGASHESCVIETWDFGQGLPEKKMAVTLAFVGAGLFGNYVKSDIRLVLSSSCEIFIADHDLEGEWAIWKVDLQKKKCVESKSLNGGALLYGDTSLLLVSSVDVQRH